MERAWIVDGPWIARNIKDASVSSSALQIKDCGVHINCPNCSHRIDNTNVLNPWPGLPKGVKFDPSDKEVIEHLEAKCGVNGLIPHLLIQHFICSSVTDINYTHPQNLPGVSKDGTSVLFFNKTAKTYRTGGRKRRKITPSGVKDESSVRWHKTGKTKRIMLNGVQKGCKEIMVLYKGARNGLKSVKTNWVLHQYHLGTKGKELGGFVVSKIFYQREKQTTDENECFGVRGGQRKPKNTTPTPVPDDEIACDDDTRMVLDPFFPGLENIPEASFGSIPEKAAQVAKGLKVTENNLVNKKIEASLSLVEKNPNFLDLDFGSEVPDKENEDIGTLPDIYSFASEDSLLNLLGFQK